MPKFVSSKSGFSLIELLIVMSMLAIIIMIALPQFINFIKRGYKSEMDTMARQAYTAAHGYLIYRPDDTVDSLDKLKQGGLNVSNNIIFVKGDFTLFGGNVELKTNEGRLADNNAVVFSNGRVEFPNMP